MKFEDVKIGMKVVPWTKTTGDCLFYEIFSNKDKYLAVCGFGRAAQIQLFNPTIYKTDFFYADNFYLYEEEPKLNYIEQVAKMLGVEVGEWFNAVENEVKTKVCFDNKRGFVGRYEILNDLICGCAVVEKIIPYAKPIKCFGGEKFKYVRIDGEIQTEQWDGGTFSHAMYALGNMFPVDAVIPQTQIDEMVKKLKGDEV